MATILDPLGDPLLDPMGSALTIGADAPVVVPDPGDFGTPGGARAPAWGGNVKLHVWLALAPGNAWTLGPHPFDRLDDGNCLTQMTSIGDGAIYDPAHNRLWIDVACDVLDVTIHTGATTADGVIARAEAGTCSLTLADPSRQYDPLNVNSPWRIGGRTRIGPGCPVVVWTESLQLGTFIIRHNLFSGTVDSWQEGWEPHPGNRRAKIEASDYTSTLVAQRNAEVAPEGAGDLVHDRLQRILSTQEGIGPTLLADPSTVTLAATTLAGTAWEQIGKAVDDEVGFAYVTSFAPNPLSYLFLPELVGLRFHPRSVWTDQTLPVYDVPCEIMIDATVDALDAQVRNVVTAQRVDGTPVTVRSQSSIERYGLHPYSKTDLGLATDEQVVEWAQYVLMMFAFPTPALSDLTLRPSNAPQNWVNVLGVDLVSEPVRIVWTPPDAAGATPGGYVVNARVVGVQHSISRSRWELKWALGASEIDADIWTLGEHANDRFDAGNILGFAHPTP